MLTTPSPFKTALSQSRGFGWVAGQMLLLATLLVIAPGKRGWQPRASITALGAAALFYSVYAGLMGIRHLGRNLTPLPVPRSGGDLVTNGIYARIRHPLYAGMMAFSVGWALLWRSRQALGVTGALIALLHTKAQYEERLLRARFPGYESYAARVPMIPRLTGAFTPAVLGVRRQFTFY